MSLYSELHDQWVDSEIWDFSLWLVAEIERLRGELEVALANRQAFQDDMLSANSRLADENSRLRAELAAAKAEPPRPAAVMANGDGDIQAYEDMQDYLATRQPRGSWGYAVRSWTWHPKSP